MWNQFIKDIQNFTQLVLVGPLYNRSHKVTSPTVYVDGGNNFRGLSTDIPTISVGDGDSANGTVDVVLPAEKDYSDLAFVLHNLPKHIRHIELLGFLGGRTDHELINYGEVHRFLGRYKEFCSARFDDLVVAFTGGALSMQIQGEFSVLVFAPTLVTITGACQYPLTSPVQLDSVSSHGLSNKGFGQVSINSLAPCFVFLN